MKKCYVYVIYVDGVARYVGQGSGRRAWDYTINVGDPGGRNSQIRRAITNGSKIKVKLVAENLPREDALKIEDRWIIKLSDTLWNGRERWNDPATRKKILEAQRKSRTAEWRESQKAGLRKAFKRSRAMQLALEAGRTPEARKKQRVSLKARIAAKGGFSEEHRRKLSLAKQQYWKLRKENH